MVDKTYTVAASADDGSECYLNHTLNYTVGTILVYQGGNWVGWDGFLRFQAVDLPNGAIIDSATLDVYCGAVTENDLWCTVYGNNVDSANDLAGEADIDGRTRTTANTVVGIDDIAFSWVQLDVAGQVQEIVNRGGWASGNAMAFMLITARAGAKKALLNSFDGGVNIGHLHVSYHAGGLSIPVAMHHYSHMTKIHRG